MKKGKSSIKSYIIIGIILILGICIMLYPTVSNINNRMHQSQAIASYVEKVENLDRDEYDSIIKKIKEYNMYLYKLTENDDLTFNKKIDILKSLEVLDGSIGYIEIPCVDIKAPIYYGASDEVLQIAIGLMEGSSFPLGDASTHAVLLGHRGLPSAKLFTDVDKLQVGDLFYINVLAERTAYEVDQIKVVLPNELDSLKIEEGKTYATLVTCTPYGVNTHRMLIRGHKVDIPPEKVEEDIITSKPDYVLIISVAILVFVLLVILIIVIIKRKKIKAFFKRRKENRKKKKELNTKENKEEQ